MSARKTDLFWVSKRSIRAFEKVTNRQVRVTAQPEHASMGREDSRGQLYLAEIDLDSDMQQAGRYDLWFWIDQRGGSIPE